MRRSSFAAAVCILVAAAWTQTSQTLPNGIALPQVWPPKDVVLSAEPPPAPPYLTRTPAVIPIDVGRQLFVDDYLIEETNLKRTFHAATYFDKNPVLRAEKTWEFVEGVGKACPFSDGVFYDPADGLFKMWYYTVNAVGYATSTDGVRWTKPELDVRPGTNVVIPGTRDSATVWLDPDATDRSRRYKALVSRGHMKPMELYYSGDGIHWGEPVAKSIPWSDRTTFFRNPFLGRWIMSLRDHDWVPRQQPDNPEHVGRMRRYMEVDDIGAGMSRWNESVLWVGADRLDGRRVDLNVRPQLYNLDAFPYESLMVGLFSIWRGQPTDRDKPNEISLGYSRDGFHWDRPYRKPFLAVSERFGDWNYANVQSAGGGALVVGDQLYFYVSGRASSDRIRTSGHMTTGLATLRRDGFASMDASGPQAAALTTRAVRFSGKRLFVNADTIGGELLVEVLNEQGTPVAGYTKADAIPIRRDNTLQMVSWKGGSDLTRLSGTPVRFRFTLRDGSLFSFWVGADEQGASGGYVGAGGPGFTGSRDTTGKRAYATCCRGTVW